MPFFKKKLTEDPVDTTLSSEKIHFDQLIHDEPKFINDLADQLIDNIPLVLSFEKLNVDDANKLIAFFSGVVYTLGGKYLRINDATFLFGSETAFNDGSLEEFVNNL